MDFNSTEIKLMRLALDRHQIDPNSIELGLLKGQVMIKLSQMLTPQPAAEPPKKKAPKKGLARKSH